MQDFKLRGSVNRGPKGRVTRPAEGPSYEARRRAESGDGVLGEGQNGFTIF